MKRTITEIDEEKCTGCGQCIPNCPEGALQVIDGKARMVSDLFCDGLGACIGHCPEGAMRTVTREAEPYDERKVMENIVRGGENVIHAHLRHLQDHGQEEYYRQAREFLRGKGIALPEEKSNAGTESAACGCPGGQMRDMRDKKSRPVESTASAKAASELRNWPVQLQLANPMAPYFDHADLLIAADCVPFSFPDFHRRFLKDKILIMFCPKLDRTIDQYIEKLALIFSSHSIRSVSVIHMEVPCCSGVLQVLEQALARAGKTLPIREYTISVGGEIV